MWPSAGPHGVRLEYGQPGAALYAPSLSLDGKWIYPRLHTNGTKFHGLRYARTYMPGTRVSLEERQRIPVDFARRQLTHIAPDSFIPSNVLSGFSKDVSRTSEEQLIHPLQTRLLDFGFARDHNVSKRRPCAAFVSGVSGSRINLSNVVDESYKLDNFDASITVPIMGSLRSYVDITDRILGLKFAGTEYSDSAGALLSVRTGRACQFYRPGIIRSDESRARLMTADLLTSVSPSSETPFSDIAFNPWYWQQFGTVDACGNWAIADLNEAQTKVTAFTSGSTNKEADIMQWHSIQWGANLNNIVVSNNKIIQSFDLRAKGGAAIAEYSPRLVSTIRHVQPVPEKSNELFVLTSEDLVWMDLRMFPKELLAWRHYRDSEDDSLRCSTFSVDDNSYALLHSSGDPVVACYQFGAQDKIPFSIDDPYILTCKRGPKLQDLVPVPVNIADNSHSDELETARFLSIFQLSMDYSLSQRIYFSDTITLPRSIELEVASSDTSWEVNEPVRFNHDYIDTFVPRLVDFHPLYERIFPDNDATLATNSDVNAVSELCEAVRCHVMSAKSTDSIGLKTLRDIVSSRGVLADLQSFSDSLDTLCEDLSNKGFLVDDLGFENLPYIGNRIDTQSMYETILDKWLHSLPIIPSSSLASQGAQQDEDTVRPFPAKARVRRERIARQIATDLTLESRVIAGATIVTDTSGDMRPDDSSAAVALNALSDYAKYRKPMMNESSNTSLLAFDWKLGKL
ncbi:RNA polymerase I-specific transcription-initiation factor-domain-containing protein [Lipomyces starkeyi]